MSPDDPEIPSPPFTLRPEEGLPTFRRNASLHLDEDAITVTDRHGRSRRFPLDGSEMAPAIVWTFGIEKQGLVDASGKLLAVWENGVWGAENVAMFSIAAGVKWGVQDDPALPPLRSDGLKIFDIPVLPMAGGFASIGIAAYGASQFDIAPDVVTVPVMIAALAGSVINLVLWKRAGRLEPDVAERRRKEMEEALADAAKIDDEDI